VATVVTKLLHIVQPDVAFFGQKDAAQVAVLQAMVRDLNFDVEIAVGPTVRDADGLALSSRNRNLRGEEREQALVLSRALERVQREAMEGEHSGTALQKILLSELRGSEGVRVDYVAVVDAKTLQAVSDVRDAHDGALVAVAAWVGGTRLIDNVVLCPVREEGGAR
jgi:pantoate--beta-alanine ligase